MDVCWVDASFASRPWHCFVCKLFLKVRLMFKVNLSIVFIALYITYDGVSLDDLSMLQGARCHLAS
jgi:hypothetical protein